MNGGIGSDGGGGCSGNNGKDAEEGKREEACTVNYAGNGVCQKCVASGKCSMVAYSAREHGET